jgi:hypothetical protein
MRARVVVFGESTKGAFSRLHRPQSLEDMANALGQPPEGSHGLYLATQTVLLQHELLFWRVDEEGFSPQDYWMGAKMLGELTDQRIVIDAVGLPGVGDWSIIESMRRALKGHQPLVLMSARDVYDYLSYGRAGG